MNRKIVFAMLVSVLLLGLFRPMFDGIVKASPSIIRVPDDHERIQWAVGNASAGDTILVAAGIYYEHVTINKTLTLIGKNVSTTIIDGFFGEYPCINITVSNVNITGFTIQEGHCGVHICSSDNDVSGNIITNNYLGIQLFNSSNNTISGNNIIDNTRGIDFEYSSNNIISDNNIANNSYYGIYVVDSSNNIISDNNVTANGIKFDDNGIEFSRSSNNTISGNNIANNENGIQLFNSSNNTISLNNITHNERGIDLYGSSNNSVYGNYVTANNWDGIGLYLSSDNNSVYENNVMANNDNGIELLVCANNNISGNNIINSTFGISLIITSNNTISGNNAINNEYGIMLDESNNNALVDNTMINNEWNFGVEGWSPPHFNNYIDTSNTVDGKPIYYLISVFDVVLDSLTNAGTVYLINCNNITVRDLTLTKNRDGIFLWNTTKSRIENVTVSNDIYGISLYHSSNDNQLVGSNISLNNWHGISFGDSSNNTLVGNIVSLNDHGGIFLVYSSNNLVYHNNFINNTPQVVTYASVNVWDYGYPSGGSYWSDYNGTDFYSGPYQNVTGSDEIGDTPYVIDEQNQDRYPLIAPWKKVSGKLEILEPANGSTIAGQVAITFTIENTGDLIQFLQGDPSNRIDLEIEYRTTDGETCGWGIVLWSTSHYGLTLHTREKYEQTLVYDPSEYEEAVPPDFIGDAPYGQTTIRLVHWKQMDGGYGYGEFGVIEIEITITFPEDINHDGKVDIKDIAIAALAFGSYPTHPRWTPIADVNQDDEVDIRDLAAIARNFGKNV